MSNPMRAIQADRIERLLQLVGKACRDAAIKNDERSYELWTAVRRELQDAPEVNAAPQVQEAIPGGTFITGSACGAAPIETNVCPDCGRVKARSADDAMAGLCPKWWAIRDQEAEFDCVRARAADRARMREKIAAEPDLPCEAGPILDHGAYPVAMPKVARPTPLELARRCADGSPPEGHDYESAITALAQEVLRLSAPNDKGCFFMESGEVKHDESNQLWAVVRLAAEVSDWERGSETLVQWAERRLNAARSENRPQESRWIPTSARQPDKDGRLWAVLTEARHDGKVTGYIPLFEYYHFIDGWATDDTVIFWLEADLHPLPVRPL